MKNTDRTLSVKNKDVGSFAKTKPIQLDLFELTCISEENYSNTIALYDAIPKYCRRKSNIVRDIKDAVIERDFVFNKQNFKVKITAAIIERENQETNDLEHIFLFPSKREELVEDALRKLAADGSHGLFLNNEAAVTFTLHELQKELQRMGHGYNKNDIKEAILICQGANIQLFNVDGTAQMKSGFFQWVGLKSQKDMKLVGGRTKGHVMFNPLVTKGIKKIQYRQINYNRCMEYRSDLARWFHKRLSYAYKQASKELPYNISLSTIFRDSGWEKTKRSVDDRRAVERALNECIKMKLLSEWKATSIKKKGRKIVDVLYLFIPHEEFINEMKRANRIYADKHLEATQRGILQ